MDVVVFEEVELVAVVGFSGDDTRGVLGVSAPPELLEGAACRSLLAELAKRYDMVLVDGPPAVLATDSTLIAKNVDATALVVRAMSEKRGQVGRIMQTMNDHKTAMIGVILNGVRSSAGGYFRKNYRDFFLKARKSRPG